MGAIRAFVKMWKWYTAPKIITHREFVGCGNYPECTFTRPISGEIDESSDRLLGEDAGDEIFLKYGRFGPYVQRGEATKEALKPHAPACPRDGHLRKWIWNVH